jgi:hypothetical protein
MISIQIKSVVMKYRHLIYTSKTQFKSTGATFNPSFGLTFLPDEFQLNSICSAAALRGIALPELKFTAIQIEAHVSKVMGEVPVFLLVQPLYIKFNDNCKGTIPCLMVGITKSPAVYLTHALSVFGFKATSHSKLFHLRNSRWIEAAPYLSDFNSRFPAVVGRTQYGLQMKSFQVATPASRIASAFTAPEEVDYVAMVPSFPKKSDPYSTAYVMLRNKDHRNGGEFDAQTLRSYVLNGESGNPLQIFPFQSGYKATDKPTRQSVFALAQEVVPTQVSRIKIDQDGFEIGKSSRAKFQK